MAFYCQEQLSYNQKGREAIKGSLYPQENSSCACEQITLWILFYFSYTQNLGLEQMTCSVLWLTFIWGLVRVRHSDRPGSTNMEKISCAHGPKSPWNTGITQCRLCSSTFHWPYKISRIPPNLQMPLDSCPNLYFSLIFKTKYRITKKFVSPSVLMVTFHDTQFPGIRKKNPMQNATLKIILFPNSFLLRGYIFPWQLKESHSLLNSSARLTLFENIKFYEQVSPSLSGRKWESEWERKWRGLAPESRVNYRLPLEIHSSSW